MTETPSHAELVAAIEQARETLERQTVTRTDSGFPHPPQVANFGVAAAVDAHLGTLAAVLQRHTPTGGRWPKCNGDHGCCSYHTPQWRDCEEIDGVVDALTRIGAL